MEGLGPGHTAYGRDPGGSNTPGSLSPSHLPNVEGGVQSPLASSVGSQSRLALY